MNKRTERMSRSAAERINRKDTMIRQNNAELEELRSQYENLDICEEDKQVIERIIGCGVTILASAHGRDRHDMLRRPMYRELFEMGAFSNIITITREGENRRYSLERLG